MHKALAIATLCCWPPDNWPGNFCAWSKIWTCSNCFSANSSASFLGSFLTQIGANVQLSKIDKWGNKLKLRRLALGLTQTKVAKAINVTFQQIQKYEKGTNGVSSIRLLQLSNYLKVPINYFFEDFSEYLINLEKSKEGHMNVNYNFLVKLYSELNNDQKIKFNKNLQISNIGIAKVV